MLCQQSFKESELMDSGTINILFVCFFWSKDSELVCGLAAQSFYWINESK